MHKFLLLLSLLPSLAIAQTWPEVKQEAKPGTRWWWLGSAVDKTNLTRNLETYAKAGIGAVEITPIYGVVGNEANDIDFLSPKWMDMLRHTEDEGRRLGIQIDMNTGTGWPFGGPEVTVEEAASRAIFKVWHSGEQQPALTEREAKDFPELKQVFAYLRTADVDASVEASLKYSNAKKRIEFQSKQHIDTLYIAYYLAKTRQQVKRAAPGGEGYVMDHLNPKAVTHYLDRFDRAFASSGVSYPATFFNDSYEVYEADWTPALFDEFLSRRGYDLRQYLPQFIEPVIEGYCPVGLRSYPSFNGGTDARAPKTHDQLIADYRETVSDLLLKVFTNTWAKWAHDHKSIVRNQAHGSPANLLDVYASVDIPEIEGFGLSDFGIKGLRRDTLTKKNDSDLSMLKYPASVAHFYGKPFVSAETFTWLTEHFRTSLSQCKPDFDLMMVAGVNHCYFHGTTYSPREAAWPGYLFYASMEMSPINTIWRDAPAFFEYITRVQSWMQYGEPDNDLLVYLPVYDIWHEYPGRLLQFDIHSMDKKAPRFIHAVNTIYNAGYDMDYCSDRMIQSITRVDADGYLLAPSGVRYKALVLPEVQYMPDIVRRRIKSLEAQGATVIWVNNPDEYVSELHKHAKIVPEELTSRYGLKCIRRRNTRGYHYFISSLQDKGVNDWVRLATPAASAYVFNPLTGEVKSARVRQQDGHAEVWLSLASGESCILQTVMAEAASTALMADVYKPVDNKSDRVVRNDLPVFEYMQSMTEGNAVDLTGNNWTLKPVAFDTWGTPGIETLHGVKAWTSLSDDLWKHGKGTVSYQTTVSLSAAQISGAKKWVIDLGDVRESAHVYVNGRDAGVAFSAPFRLEVGKLLKAGSNTITVEVTGLAANYVAEMDRRGIKWRIFKNANIANLKGGPVSYYGNWDVMPCGLNSTVRLIPLK